MVGEVMIMLVTVHVFELKKKKMMMMMMSLRNLPSPRFKHLGSRRRRGLTTPLATIEPRCESR